MLKNMGRAARCIQGKKYCKVCADDWALLLPKDFIAEIQTLLPRFMEGIARGEPERTEVAFLAFPVFAGWLPAC